MQSEAKETSMGEHVTLRASDGHELDGYVARPAGAAVARHLTA